MIYVASPYSHPDYNVRLMRYSAAEFITAKLILQGLPAFSPIVHCHAMAVNQDLPSTFDFWKRYCLSMLRSADALWVVEMEGTAESVGVKMEVEFARSVYIPIYPVELTELRKAHH